MEARVLAQCNEVALIEVQPGALAVIERPGGYRWLMLVVGVIGVQLGGVGLVELVQGDWQAGAPLVVVGVLFVGLGLGVWRARRRQLQKPWWERTILLKIDTVRGSLLSPDGRPLAWLMQTALSREFQLTSSSRSLRLSWPGGSVVVGRGNPFGDSVDAMEEALRRAGVRLIEKCYPEPPADDRRKA